MSNAACEVQPISSRKAILIVCGSVIASHLAIFLLLQLSHISISVASFFSIYKLVGILLPVIAITYWRKMYRIAEGTTAVALWFCFLGPALVATYLGIGFGMPLADSSLASMDRTLGLDWPRLAAFVNERPQLVSIFELSYASFGWQLVSLPLLLALIGKSARAFSMVFSYALICFIASVITIWFPSIGAYAHFQLDPEQFQNLNIAFGNSFLPEFYRAWAGTDTPFDFRDMKGIVSFPSVHAAVGILCAWAAWTTRWIRFPVLLVNIIMILSAISVGSHYGVDIIAGIGVGALSIAVSSRVFSVTRMGWQPYPEAKQPVTI